MGKTSFCYIFQDSNSSHSVCLPDPAGTGSGTTWSQSGTYLRGPATPSGKETKIVTQKNTFYRPFSNNPTFFISLDFRVRSLKSRGQEVYNTAVISECRATAVFEWTGLGASDSSALRRILSRHHTELGKPSNKTLNQGSFL